MLKSSRRNKAEGTLDKVAGRVLELVGKVTGKQTTKAKGKAAQGGAAPGPRRAARRAAPNADRAGIQAGSGARPRRAPGSGGQARVDVGRVRFVARCRRCSSRCRYGPSTAEDFQARKKPERGDPSGGQTMINRVWIAVTRRPLRPSTGS